MASITYKVGYNFVIPEPDDGYVNMSVAQYAADNNWSDGTKYYTMNLDGVTATLTGGSADNGEYDSSDESWVLKVGEVDVSTLVFTTNDSTKKIKRIIINYEERDTGQSDFKYFEGNVLGGTTEINVAPNSNTATFTFARRTTGTFSAELKITNIIVEYEVAHEVTVSHTLSEVGSHYGWSNGYVRDNWYLDYDASTPGVHVTLVNTGSNNGLYNSGTYRVNLYRVQVTAPTGKKIKSFKITFTKSASTVTARGFMPDDTYKNLTSGTAWELTTPADYIQFRGGSQSNQYITVTEMEVTYE